MTRGIYVLHTPKQDNPNIYKVGMSGSIEERKGDYETVFPQEKVVMSLIYELHDGVDIHRYEGILHDMLEARGYKLPNKVEHFAATLDEIDDCATDMFMQFPDILKKVHNEDRTASSSRKSKKVVDNVQDALRTFDQLIEAEARTSQTETTKNTYQRHGKFKLRVDQEELMARLQQHFMEENNPRGQIHLPPGYGKTEVGCCLFPVVNNIKRALILVPTIRLAEETMKRIKAFHGVTHYNYFEVHSNSITCDIDAIRNCEYVYVVAVYNSVIKLHNTTPFDIIIFDEAHRTSIKCQTQNQDKHFILTTHLR